ncbi:MAG: XkdF-like putative serine protease domain-containing protein [Angelakisella sp.]
MGVVYTCRTQEARSSATIYRDDGSTSTTSVYLVESEDSSVPYDEASLAVNFNISKANEAEGLVSGWANVALDKDGNAPLDWQDDVIMPDTLEKAAIQFMLEYGESGVMHAGESKGVVVESIVLTKEKQAAIGIPEGAVPHVLDTRHGKKS